MRLISKLFCHQTTVLATLIIYFIFLNAGFIPCCPCTSGSSHVLSCDPEHNHNKHSSGTHKKNMDVSSMALASSSNHSHNCGCEGITVSNYLVEETDISYRSIKPDKYNLSFAHFVETVPFSFCFSSRIPHFHSHRFVNSTIQSIRTIVLLT